MYAKVSILLLSNCDDKKVDWLVMFNVPSTARSFRNGDKKELTFTEKQVSKDSSTTIVMNTLTWSY